jgi:hypothetical protein
MGWVWTGIMAVLTIALIYLVVQGTLFIGWALGGVVGVILAILLAAELIKDGGFFMGLLGIIVLCLIFQWLF